MNCIPSGIQVYALFSQPFDFPHNSLRFCRGRFPVNNQFIEVLSVTMKILFYCVAVATICSFVLTTNGFENRALAQSKQTKFSRDVNDDRELSDFIKSHTARTSDGLTEIKTYGGGTTVDLAGRYQNVMLARIDSLGEPVAACITELGEANNFLGRDLETGRPIASIDFFTRDLQANARRHGMSVDEFSFYSRLANDFASGQAANAPSAAAFSILNADGAGEGFNEATAAFVVGEGGNTGTTRGAQRLNVFNAAAAVWASFLDSNVTTTISSQFNVIAGCTPSGGVLGSAGTVNVHRNFAGAEFPATWYHAALANKRAGVDLNVNPEMQAQFNTAIDSACLGVNTRFYYGLDNATPANRINLFVVVLHEIGHGVGFSSFVNGSTGVFFGTPANPDIYSRYMFDSSNSLYWHQMTDAQRQASATNANNVYWDGPSLRLASGSLTSGRDAATGRVQLFTPLSFQGGSSISHFSTAAFPSLLMEPNITSGLPINLDLTRQVMRDVGWYRDTTVDLSPDTITSVTPNDSFVQIGQTQNILWVNNGGFNRNVTIELSLDGGSTFSAIATDIVNSGSFAWTVPNSPSNQARIRVREAGFASPSGVSSASFSIVFAPSSAPASISGRVIGTNGRGVSGARVTLTSDSGQNFVTRTNVFGNFRFTEIPTGRTYFATASSKGMRFDTQAIDLASDIVGLELRAAN